MIVGSMTEVELLDELMKDMRAVFAYSDTKNQKIRRHVIKATKFPIRFEAEYISPRKNKWLLFFEAYSKKNIFDNILMTSVCVFNSPFGWHAAMLSFHDEGEPYWNFYPPHLFSRYGERTNRQMHGIELIKEFFRYNFAYTCKYEKGGLFASSTEGASYGAFTTHGNILFKTFLSENELRSEQLAVHKDNSETLTMKRISEGWV